MSYLLALVMVHVLAVLGALLALGMVLFYAYLFHLVAKLYTHNYHRRKS